MFPVSGPDAENFLQNVITTDLDHLEAGVAKPGALLTPQGKILADFLVSRNDGGGFLIDVPDSLAEILVSKLTLYKMRAKAEIGKPEQELIGISWNSDSKASQSDSTIRDGRFPADPGVFRSYRVTDQAARNEEGWQMLKIQHAVAECGTDYETNSAFPHDVLMDFNGGISFTKGCFIGQEVVSRMHHRGTARRRVMVARSEDDLPAAGTVVTSDGRSIGVLASTSGNTGLALVRTDRASEAIHAGTALEADGIALRIEFPEAIPIVFPAAPETETGS